MKAHEDLEATGPNPALPDQVAAAVTARHPTLNTKPLFKLMVEKKASDLFFTSNAPIKIKIEGQILPVNKQVLTPETVRQTAFALMSAAQREHFLNEWELDFAVSEPGLGRFRVNVFMQRGYPAMVMRYITADMPRLDSLGLPEIVTELTLQKRGLLLMVGATGSGKSTTLAAMLNYRNENASDHIVTIEDPIEFLHTNKRSLLNQREVGLDTKSYMHALRGVVRAAPDVILIGEVRDKEGMEAAISLSGTGHLVLLKRGLILMIGATGSGKSTSLAAMINYRNENASDHIVTIERLFVCRNSIGSSMVTMWSEEFSLR